MRQRGILNYRFIFVALVVAILAQGVIAEVLYVDSTNGISKGDTKNGANNIKMWIQVRFMPGIRD